MWKKISSNLKVLNDVINNNSTAMKTKNKTKKIKQIDFEKQKKNVITLTVK